jgi:hypothetical protein
MKITNMISQSDHDLLIELRTEMQNVRNDIRDLKDGTATRIKCLEDNKVDLKDFKEIQKKLDEDMEVRLRKLEESKSIYYTSMLIYTAVGVTMIGLIIYHMFTGA